MSVSRRRFLRSGALGGLAAGLMLKSNTFAFGHDSNQPVDHVVGFSYSRADFEPHVGSNFRLRQGKQQLDLKLVHLTDFQPSRNAGTFKVKSTESFVRLGYFYINGLDSVLARITSVLAAAYCYRCQSSLTPSKFVSQPDWGNSHLLSQTNLYGRKSPHSGFGSVGRPLVSEGAAAAGRDGCVRRGYCCQGRHQSAHCRRDGRVDGCCAANR